MTDLSLSALKDRRGELEGMRRAIEDQRAQDRFIVKAFKVHKRDTFDIAQALKVPESAVANRLARLREAGELR